MQTDPRKSEALRMRRKIVREFITRERGILIMFVCLKREFFIVPARHVHVCLGTGAKKVNYKETLTVQGTKHKQCTELQQEPPVGAQKAELWFSAS